MKAPIATTTKIVPKNIVAEPVYGSMRNGAKTPAKRRANDSPKNMQSAPAQRRRELLGQVHPGCGKRGQHGKAGDQRARDHHDRCVVPGLMRHQHQAETGKRSGERVGDRPAPPDDLHQIAGEGLAWDAGEIH